ncbi:MAG: type II toxin-antitoxin system RelE/ParE family toxin [Candidatus Omnitrophica bacterium]|nr:type II toxin-antitoxin system RelE/ParE family toxin [Candidatus Omnitrophota bacterium]
MYRIYINPSARKDLDYFDKKLFTQIKNKIVSLASDPRPPNCLKLTTTEGYRIRSGDYRILYRIDDKNKIIYIYRIKHRKESYR